MSRALVGLLLGVAVAAVIAASAVLTQRHKQADRALAARLAPTTTLRGTPTDCAPVASKRPLVVLALGQSNAANHGRRATHRPALMLYHEGRCVLSSDPLPGGTGEGASLWSDLVPMLAPPVLLSVLAVDATTIDDWTRPGSPLRARLVAQLHGLHDSGLRPDLILWLQGEADARHGASSADYRAGLRELRSVIGRVEDKAPIVVAYATVCRTPPNAEIRRAIDAEIATDSQLRRGPDLDTLRGDDLRYDGCHFSAEGLKRAAELWRAAIADAVPARAR